MWRLLKPFVSLLLATVFTVVGLFGHGLHGFLPCQHDGTHDGTVCWHGLPNCHHLSNHGLATHAGCGCRHGKVHAHANQATAPQATRVAGHPAASTPGHDADQCPVCSALALLRHGISTNGCTVWLPHVQTEIFHTSSPAKRLLPQHVAEARGPPPRCV